MYFAHGVGCAYLIVILLVTGQLLDAFMFCLQHPYVYVYMMVPALEPHSQA